MSVALKLVKSDQSTKNLADKSKDRSKDLSEYSTDRLEELSLREFEANESI